MAIMTSTQRRTAPTAPHVATRRVRDDLWRVSSASGLALGYIAKVESSRLGGPAYEARRLLPGGTTMVPIGRGWAIEDALACFTGP
ncbi:hypothetical protein [Agrococcus baldri]|uniref:Uncharacterized protein n=1 Tax=Agrococcus baldri TaxID=153730 RepID=A0AA87RDN2_9MICO|nr:hypothetical protein [Agrococcus baldri]GEK78701.1 hypothetical protein ABA31_00520 [Agrococcus baldri]